MTAVTIVVLCFLIPVICFDSEKVNNAQRKFRCYQCNSYSTDINPICDNAYFKLTRPHEKEQTIVHCPRHLQDFCVKKIIRNESYVQTTRGCSNLYDSDGNQLKVGCIVLKDREETTICFCDKSECNGVDRNFVGCYLLLFIVMFVEIGIIKRI